MSQKVCHCEEPRSGDEAISSFARQAFSGWLAKGTLGSRCRRLGLGTGEKNTRPTRPAPPRNDMLVIGFIAILLSACTNFIGYNLTPVVAISSANPDQVPRETPTFTPEPFRLTLPTQGAEPISGWRPPLYPIPWSMSPYDHFYFARPIAADQVNWPLADYRYGGVFFAPNVVHTGVDIPAPEGAPIMAAGDGTIIWADWGLFTGIAGYEDDPYGQAVVIRHDFGYHNQQLFTVYAHMSRIDAVEGQHVQTGDQIGLVGDTGATTGPHLHFEVRFPNDTFFSTYNPELWMAPPQGWGVLVGHLTNARGEWLQQLEVNVESQASHQTRIVKTYGGGATNPDPYYEENLVLGDLPAGIYKIYFRADDKTQQTWVTINPGQISYFSYRSTFGFDLNPPPTPTVELPAAIGTPSR